jgi:hypothetical protein
MTWVALDCHASSRPLGSQPWDFRLTCLASPFSVLFTNVNDGLRKPPLHPKGKDGWKLSCVKDLREKLAISNQLAQFAI